MSYVKIIRIDESIADRIGSSMTVQFGPPDICRRYEICRLIARCTVQQPCNIFTVRCIRIVSLRARAGKLLCQQFDITVPYLQSISSSDMKAHGG